MAAKLLIAGSDEPLHANLVKSLAPFRYRIFGVNNAEEAEHVVRKHNIDVAVLDLRMLRRGGIVLLQTIKKIRPLTEAILINSSQQLSLSIEGMKLGAFDDLLVPFDLHTLAERIRSALDCKRAEEGALRTLLRRAQDMMVAVSFAEAGEHDIARDILREREGFHRNCNGNDVQDEKNRRKKRGEEDRMSKFKILLVDDEESFVQTLSERIKMRQLDSEIALNGAQALEKVGDRLPDVMVLDLRMPGIDGMEVLRRVKKSNPEIQVIILTGHGSENDEKEARRLGAFDYLSKPVDIDHLINTMRKAYKAKMEDAMVAATFAEAGDFKTAREILTEDKKEKK